MKTNRKFILIAFALATFATLYFTMGPRWHGHHHGCAAACEQQAPATQE